jgi:hypothetical protein
VSDGKRERDGTRKVDKTERVSSSIMLMEFRWKRIIGGCGGRNITVASKLAKSNDGQNARDMAKPTFGPTDRPS